MRRATLGLVLGPSLALACGSFAHLAGLGTPAAWTAAVTGLCATWWITEPVPIPVTSIIPFAAFPLVGVLDHATVANAYGHTLILLLLGGFVLSTAMERSGAHRRLALGMVRAVGGDGGRRLVLGFMIACAALSMWISNTAAVLMLLPVAIAVLEQDREGTMGRPLLLGTAYAASIGGLGTPVGTPPNVIFMGIYRETTGVELSFVDWMRVGVPVTLLLIPLTWVWLTRGIRGKRQLELPRLGPWRPSEVRVLCMFAFTATAWVTRTEPFGGWSQLLGSEGAGDSTVALAAVVLMFVIPDGEGGRLLDWETANRIPWGLLILFGGGIALARGFEVSGLSAGLGAALSGLASWPTVLMIAVLCLGVTFMTEVTSNTATATLLMPVLAAAAAAASIEPALLMAPAALSASCAFMLPVATAPNAVVFGTNRFTVSQMAREGFVVNLMGAVVITAVCAWLLS
jgi:solute carrier family 13 (sodium-dependent dicarboxylate transporter), member 2/3/5